MNTKSSLISGEGSKRLKILGTIVLFLIAVYFYFLTMSPISDLLPLKGSFVWLTTVSEGITFLLIWYWKYLHDTIRPGMDAEERFSKKIRGIFLWCLIGNSPAILFVGIPFIPNVILQQVPESELSTLGWVFSVLGLASLVGPTIAWRSLQKEEGELTYIPLIPQPHEQMLEKLIRPDPVSEIIITWKIGNEISTLSRRLEKLIRVKLQDKYSDPANIPDKKLENALREASADGDAEINEVRNALKTYLIQMSENMEATFLKAREKHTDYYLKRGESK